MFVVLQLRKTMVITWRLPYPSATAAGTLLNSIHTPKGEGLAWAQVKNLGIVGTASFLWDFFEWFFGGSGAGDSNCGADGPAGFGSMPNLGLKAAKWTWYYDNELTYIGCGMLVPQIVNASMMAGAILSWGILWPIFDTKGGKWFAAGLESNDVRGRYGYEIFLSLAMFIGDGVYNFFKVTYVSVTGIIHQRKIARAGLPRSTNETGGETRTKQFDQAAILSQWDSIETQEERLVRERVFNSESFPLWLSVVGYVSLGAIAAGCIPQIFPPYKWYYVLIMWAIGPLFSVTNAYGAGLTNWNLASTYGKLCIVVFAAWAGADSQGVTAGLATCGVMLAVTNAACTLMSDFKTGYYTCSSPRAQFIAQFIGELFGIIFAPAAFYLYFKGFPNLGLQGTTYPAPYATIYRALAVVVAGGVSQLPGHCLLMVLIFFLAAIALCAFKDFGPRAIRPYVPIPMAMALPFYLGAWLALDFCIGGVILFIWQKINQVGARNFVVPTAAGLIVGEGLWSLPSAILGVAGAQPPICMTFLPSAGTSSSDSE